MKGKFVVIALVLIAMSCDYPDEFVRDQPKDPKGINFGIKITSPKVNELMDGIFTINIEPTFASTQYNLKSMNILINDSLLTSSFVVPVRFQLNTHGHDFGMYSIKCNAISKDGRTSSDSVSFAMGSTEINLYKLIRQDANVLIQWRYDADVFFKRYEIYVSDNSAMNNPKLVASIEDPSIKSCLKLLINSEAYYQISAVNNLGYLYKSNIQGIIGSIYTTHINNGGKAHGVAVGSDGTIILANWNDGLRAYSFNGSWLTNTAHIITPDEVMNVDVDDDGTIIVAGNYGLSAYVYNGSSFTKPAQIRKEWIGNARDIAIGHKGIIFFANDWDGLYAYAFAGSSFTINAHINNGGNAYGVAVGSDGTIFLANANDGLRAYTFDGSSFTNTAHINNGGEARGVAIGPDGTIFLANYTDGLRAYTYNGSSFKNTAHIYDGGEAECVAIGADGKIFLAGGYRGLNIYTYNGLSFNNTAHINNGGYTPNVAVGIDRTIVLANWEDGLRVYTYEKP